MLPQLAAGAEEDVELINVVIAGLDPAIHSAAALELTYQDEIAERQHGCAGQARA